MKLRHIIPFGLLEKEKPRYFNELFKVFLQNRDSLPYAYRILTRGVCDGCSLGPQGVHDKVMDGIHLCTTRLRLLRLNTMPPAGDKHLQDVKKLQALSGRELMWLGRLSFPMIRRRGEERFERISWEKAINIAADNLKNIPAQKTGWYITSRGLYNEAYYVFQKVARIFGSQHIDNSARLCHAPSVIGLHEALGTGAPTCSLKDLIGTDLLILWGTNLASNQPVTMKYLYLAKKKGTRIIVVNPYCEPGFKRYWIPSVAISAIFGTKLMDDYFKVKVGGDIAFVYGIMKVLDENKWFDYDFINKCTVGFDAVLEKTRKTDWEEIEKNSGLTRQDCERFADLYSKAKTSVFLWSMGLTQHKFGVENVRSILTLGLSRGMIGREKCGFMPIRGHSSVQGAAECGVAPNKFPSGMPINDETAKHLESLWGVKPPTKNGFSAPEMISGAADGSIEALYTVGGNFIDTLPDPEYVRHALQNLKLRIHQDIVMNSSMLLDADVVLVLPAATRYETPGGITQTNTERRITYSPEIPGQRIPETKHEWEIPILIAKELIPNASTYFPYKNTAEIRDEMDKVIPLYKGIKDLKEFGDNFVWGGDRLFGDMKFKDELDGKAQFKFPNIKSYESSSNEFILSTRRGKQFNSMILDINDPQTGGSKRNTLFINDNDAKAQGFEDGMRVIVTSNFGKTECILKYADVAKSTVQMFWPECNVLIPSETDPISKEPDYNVYVKLFPSKVI
ncbi:MAG: FdhF/YdeP family oxidoreductase [Candidatus Methanoperedens sp.]